MMKKNLMKPEMTALVWPTEFYLYIDESPIPTSYRGNPNLEHYIIASFYNNPKLKKHWLQKKWLDLALQD